MSSVDAVQDMPQATDEHLTRHTLATRLNHWLMAVSVIVLILSSFLPILDIKFAWVTIHWVSGLVFSASIVFHTFYAMMYQDWRSMWVKLSEFVDFFSSMTGKLDLLKISPGKYWLPQKLYHHIITVFGITVIITGILMMFKIDSPFWERDPYFLASETWGIVYVLHGFASLCFVPMLMMIDFDPAFVLAMFRIGDSSTNIISPMSPYFSVALVYMQRYKPDMGLGTLIATMLPLAMGFLLAWSAFLMFWLMMGWPIGPGVYMMAN